MKPQRVCKPCGLEVGAPPTSQPHMLVAPGSSLGLSSLGSWAIGLLVGLLVGMAMARPLSAQTWRDAPRVPPAVIGEVRHAGGVVRIAFKPGGLNVGAPEMLAWVQRSAQAVTAYFGRFPVPLAEISFETSRGEASISGRASSDDVPSIRMTLNRNIAPSDLLDDSVLVHEMTHLAIPDVAARHLWLHEGIATYVEFVSRAQAGFLRPEDVWERFVEELPAGLPGRGARRGLDGSTSTDRVYWGGALFCLTADIEIRKATGNRRGLADALRAVQRAGGNLAREWSIERFMAVADAGTGTQVMSRLYRTHGIGSAAVDLDRLWRELGVITTGRGVRLSRTAPLAAVRDAITGRPPAPILLSNPRVARHSRAAAMP